MEEQLVKFETAKLAKEKGFNWQCENVFYENGEAVTLPYYGGGGSGSVGNFEVEVFCDTDVLFTAPTQSLLQKWLREEHEIDLWCERFTTKEDWIWQCPKLNRITITDYHDTFEEALEKGLQEALKLIK